VVVATSGPAALALLDEGRFDLVCTDLGMPGMNGWEVARRVHERAPATPVVMITGWGIQLDPAELAANGITSVLFKPYRMHAVQELVAQALAARAIK
jgi:CheY-like chemotaxis protein